jgi:hypothetical protein
VRSDPGGATVPPAATTLADRAVIGSTPSRPHATGVVGSGTELARAVSGVTGLTDCSAADARTAV